MKHAQVDDLPLFSPSADLDEVSPMDDLTIGLAKARRKPWLTRSTKIMLGLVLICAGFLAGLHVQKTYGTANPGTGTLPANLAERFQRGGGAGQQPGAGTGTGAPTAAAPTTGKVKLVDGNTLYIETEDGRVITVKTGENTTVQSATPAELKNLAAGTQVTVQGATAGTTITATSITASP